MEKIKFFSTPIISGVEIESYLGVVIVHQVAGTGFLTDLTASFSDFFGGHSGAYRNELEGLNRDVMEQASNKAFALGANAIIGFHMDFDSIAGKSMSMLMVSGQGTAVKIKDTSKSNPTIDNNCVTKDFLNREFCKARFIAKTNNDKLLDQDEWKFVIENRMTELTALLYKDYVKVKTTGMELDASFSYIKDSFEKLLSMTPYNEAIEIVYSEEYCAVNLIKKLNLFNASKLLELLKANIIDFETATYLLDVEKASYSENDLIEMKSLADYFDNLPNLGKIEEAKGGVFSSSGLKYFCPSGHKNDPQDTFCDNCGLNIKGLNKEQCSRIDNFKEKVAVLEKIFAERKDAK